MRRPLGQRLLLVFAPALVLGAIAVSAVWGDAGLVRRHDLKDELRAANQRLADTDRENQRLLRDLRLLETDRTALRRTVAEELGYGPKGATMYRFEPAGASSGAASSPRDAAGGNGPNEAFHLDEDPATDR